MYMRLVPFVPGQEGYFLPHEILDTQGEVHAKNIPRSNTDDSGTARITNNHHQGGNSDEKNRYP